MIETFHRVAQYLATTAISFMASKEDDSHTNLGWKEEALHTHSMSDLNDVLSLDYRSFSLVWSNDSGFESALLIDGKSHVEIVNWIRGVAASLDFENPYSYQLHYDLPYNQISDDYVFEKPSEAEINQLIGQRDLLHEGLLKVLQENNQEPSIRIWPHHFDSGSFFNTDTGIGIGLGMAIPDGMINDFYFYVSGYNGHDAIAIKSIENLENGTYFNAGWQGFALPVSGVNQSMAVRFFNQAIEVYKSFTG